MFSSGKLFCATNAIATYISVQQLCFATIIFFLSFWCVGKKHRRRFDWTKEVAVVTGGSSGIGAQIVEQLLKRGTRVANIDLAPSQNAEAISYTTDVTDPIQVRESAAQIRKKFGDATILINNAGITKSGTSLLESDPQRLALTLNINLIAQFYTIREFVPHMVKNGYGHIVSTASAASYLAPPYAVDYAVAKAGLVALHEGLETELHTLHSASTVHASIIHPYFVTTPLIAGDFPDSSNFLKPEIVAATIIKRIECEKGGIINLPGWVGLLRFIRVLPLFMARRIRVYAARAMLHKQSTSNIPKRNI